MYSEAERPHPSTARIMSRGFVLLLCVLTAIAALSGPSADAAPARPLPFFYDLYTFRGDTDTSTTVIAAFAVPVERLRRESANGEALYRFDVTLVLSDTALSSVSRRDDSVYVSVARPLPGKHLLFTNVEVQAPPSVSTLQRVIILS